MITVYQEKDKLFCNEDNIIIYRKQESFDASTAICGGCGTKGVLSFFRDYKRWLEILKDGVPICEELTLDRYQCNACKKTHVIIPGGLIIPYMRHSLEYILTVIEAYKNREKPVRQIAADFQIVVSTLYVWVDMFEEHCGLLLGKLETSSGDIGKSLNAIIDNPDVMRLFFEFVETYGICFLQTIKTTHYFTLRGYLIFSFSGLP